MGISNLSAIIFRFRDYSSLLRRADEVFPTTEMADNFKNMVEQAYQNGDSLTILSFAMEAFETLRDNDNSPLYQQKLASIAKDSRFQSFAQLSTELGSPYDLTPAFNSTPEISEALTTHLAGKDASIINTDTNQTEETEPADMLNPTNKVVLNVSPQGTVENPEVILSPDGHVPQSKVTTSVFEQCKKHAIETAYAQRGKEEAQEMADKFNAADEAATAVADNNVSALDALPTPGPETLVIDSTLKEEQQAINTAYREAKKRLEASPEPEETGSAAPTGGVIELGFAQ